MRSHRFNLTVPATRFQKVADKIVRSGVEVTHRGCMVDLAIKFDGEEEDITMQEALDVVKTARGDGRHGKLARTRMTLMDHQGNVVGVQQTIQFD